MNPKHLITAALLSSFLSIEPGQNVYYQDPDAGNAPPIAAPQGYLISGNTLEPLPPQMEAPLTSPGYTDNTIQPTEELMPSSIHPGGIIGDPADRWPQ